MKEDFITHFACENFKSISSLEIDCKRINVFIGMPNVGKSNILEALALFGVGLYENPEADFCKIIRAISAKDFFHLKDIKQEIDIRATVNGKEKILIGQSGDLGNNIKFYSANKDYTSSPNLSDDLKELSEEIDSESGKRTELFSFESRYNRLSKENVMRNILYYRFDPTITDFRMTQIKSLSVPFGRNLVGVLETHPELLEEIGELFEPYGVAFGIDVSNMKIMVRRDLTKTHFVSFDYSLLADTIRRVIFYLTAIHSNENCILLFEEPESHAHPAYIQRVMRAVCESETNQFFINTHSPYVVETLLDEAPDETVVFVVDFDRDTFSTRVHPVSEDKLGLMNGMGEAMFFNLEHFISE